MISFCAFSDVRRGPVLRVTRLQLGFNPSTWIGQAWCNGCFEWCLFKKSHYAGLKSGVSVLSLSKGFVKGVRVRVTVRRWWEDWINESWTSICICRENDASSRGRVADLNVQQLMLNGGCCVVIFNHVCAFACSSLVKLKLGPAPKVNHHRLRCKKKPNFSHENDIFKAFKHFLISVADFILLELIQVDLVKV